MLNKVQRRAEIISDGHPEQQTGLHSLQHCRDMASLATLYIRGVKLTARGMVSSGPPGDK